MTIREKIEAVYRKRHATVGKKLDALEALFEKELSAHMKPFMAEKTVFQKEYYCQFPKEDK